MTEHPELPFLAIAQYSASSAEIGRPLVAMSDAHIRRGAATCFGSGMQPNGNWKVPEQHLYSMPLFRNPHSASFDFGLNSRFTDAGLVCPQS
jgi:hypothetical protein